jgi:uncharacterized OB-fold protein
MKHKKLQKSTINLNNQPDENNFLKYRGKEARRFKCKDCGHLRSEADPCCWQCNCTFMDDKDSFIKN